MTRVVDGPQRPVYRELRLQGWFGGGGCSGVVVGDVNCDFGWGVLLAAAGFPTVKYLRILSKRFLPIPRIASKSSTLLNNPYDFRICKIFSAVTGPIPGTCCSSSDVAVLIFTGFSGGFFVAERTTVEKTIARKREERMSRIASDRHAIVSP
jgi:hypothetical protein